MGTRFLEVVYDEAARPHQRYLPRGLGREVLVPRGALRPQALLDRRCARGAARRALPPGNFVNQNAGVGYNWANARYTKAGHEFCYILLICSGLCSKVRAPHRGTPLGSCVWGGGACLLAVFIYTFVDIMRSNGHTV
jgi:hypothetical protein